MKKYTKVQKIHYQTLRDVLSPSNYYLYPSSLHISYTAEDSEVFIGEGIAFGMLSDIFGEFWTLNSKYGIDIEQFDPIINFISAGWNVKEFRNVPEYQALKLTNSNRLSVKEEDIANHQYIYRTNDLIALQGAKYSKVRREITKFLSIYSDDIRIDEVLNIEYLSKKTIYKKLFDGWVEFGTSGSENVEDEEYTFNNFIELSDYSMFSKPVIIEIWYGDMLVALSVNDIISKDYAINFFHFSNLNLSGISYYLFHTTCRILRNKGVEYLNFQQDCGISGLREFKNYLRPHKLEKQYSIKINN